jgi:hypothetical protein
VPDDPLANVVARFATTVAADILGTVERTLRDAATARTSKQLITFINRIGTPPGQGAALAAHRTLARNMQESVIASWGQARRRMPARPAVYDPVRNQGWGRDSRAGGPGGHDGMDQAVRDKDLIVATARGIQFGNVAALDRHARLGIDEDPRPGYGLPRGGFKGPDGKWQAKGEGIPAGAFYPRKGSRQEFPTAGNKGYDYLGAGIRRLFADLPHVYGDLFRETLSSRERTGRPPRIAETKRIS